ncbi:MAG: mechanosensitive ion channel [Candidatus Cloacimonadota bacterium]|nr:mechanosensitive ion channel [Candidatus Cloacimonadota bacterium]
MQKDIINNLIKNSTKLLEKFQGIFFSKEGLIQFVILIILFIISTFIYIIIKKAINKSYVKKKNSLSLNLNKLIFATTFLLLNSITIQILKSNTYQIVILEIINQLIFAFLVIHIISKVTIKSGISKILSIIIWFMVILNILDLLAPLLQLLDGISVEFGEKKVSILLAIKSAIVLILATWLSLKISNFTNSFVERNENLNPTLKVLISKILKIVVVTSAIVLALTFIGIKLTAFALFGSAIGVGLGFGLQKIVSNFMSGFILLFDKSIKPGDVISIDATFGWIKSMTARYITVSTIDGKEHLIPNEDLITSKVVNWSHSNKMIRLNVDVGVSYNADIPKALKLVKISAISVSRVLKNPEPVALLLGFGDSSINLRLKFWITDPEKGIENIKSDIHLNIWKKFKEEDIEIPFPQTDVHIIPQKMEEV